MKWRHNPRLGVNYKTGEKSTTVRHADELCYANNPNSLFRKYAHLVTAFANHDTGRDWLELPDVGPFDLVLPNGFHLRDGDEGYMEVTTRAVLAPCLYPVLKELDVYLPWIKDADEALEYLFWGCGLIKKSEPIPELAHKIMLGSTNFNPDANPETTSVDGFCYSDNESTWNAAHDDTDANASDTGTHFDCNSDYVSGVPYYRISRSFILFDTSALDDNSGVSATTLYVTSYGGTRTVGVVQCSPASNTSLSGTDYDQCGSVNSPTEGCTRFSADGSGQHSPTLNATGRSWVSKTGVTKLGLRTSLDMDDTAATDDVSANPRFYSAENGSNIPQLTVTWSTTSTSTTTTSTSTSTSTTTTTSTSTSTTTTSTSTSTTTTTSTSTTVSQTTSTSTSTTTTTSTTTSTSTTTTSTSTTTTSTSTTTTSTSTTTTSTSTSTTTVSVPREFAIDNPAV